jgi:hypothetical protein
MVVIMPLVLVGAGLVVRAARARERGAAAALFVLFYVLLTLLAVAATSLDTRHYGQFLPAVLILAALPGPWPGAQWGELRLTRALWLALVVAIHVAWAALKLL